MKTTATRTELEAKVLGAVLANSDKLYELPATITDAVFSQGVLSRVWRALHRQAKSKKLPSGALDLAAVCTWSGLEGDQVRDMLDAALEAGRGCQLDQVAAALLDAHRRTGAVELLAKAQQAFAGDAATEEVIAQVATGILDLDRPGAPEVSDARESLIDAIDCIEQCQVGGGKIVKTGFPDLDKRLKMRPGNLIILAARPGVGKTTFAFNAACNVAAYRMPTSTGKRVLVHSFEMNRAELMILAISRAAHIDSQRLFEQNTITAEEWTRIAEEGDKIGRNGNLLFNTQYPSLHAVCSITRKQHRKNQLALVVVDYLQLMSVDLGKNFNREQQVSTITRALKNLAEELEVPILALSQLNRETVKKDTGPKKGRGGELQGPATSPPPALHELRESGAIEQDANAVVFLHNPFTNSTDEYAKEHGPFDCIVAKQRLGKKGAVQIVAELAMSEFKSFTRSARDMATETE